MRNAPILGVASIGTAVVLVCSCGPTPKHTFEAYREDPVLRWATLANCEAFPLAQRLDDADCSLALAAHLQGIRMGKSSWSGAEENQLDIESAESDGPFGSDFPPSMGEGLRRPFEQGY